MQYKNYFNKGPWIFFLREIVTPRERYMLPKIIGGKKTIGFKNILKECNTKS